MAALFQHEVEMRKILERHAAAGSSYRSSNIPCLHSLMLIQVCNAHKTKGLACICHEEKRGGAEEDEGSDRRSRQNPSTMQRLCRNTMTLGLFCPHRALFKFGWQKKSGRTCDSGEECFVVRRAANTDRYTPSVSESATSCVGSAVRLNSGIITTPPTTATPTTSEAVHSHPLAPQKIQLCMC